MSSFWTCIYLIIFIMTINFPMSVGWIIGIEKIGTIFSSFADGNTIELHDVELILEYN